MMNIDLKLLMVVLELQRTGSVSHTAENLGLSQSAVSMILARLRKHFNDPLFVRTSAGMVPTPYAAELLGELRKATDILESALEHRLHFDPSTSERMFHICSTDIAQFTILPPLAKRLAAVAPSVRVNLRNIEDDTPRMLERGEADLAIGLIPQMGAGFCQQKLFASRFVCALRADHPRIGNTMSVEQYQNESHLSVTMLGTGYHTLEKTLEAQKIHRKIGMRVPSFLGVASIVAATDFLAIVPERLGRLVSATSNMKLLPLPFPLAGYNVTQNWHERYTLDPAQQWFRNLVIQIFREEEKAAAAKPQPEARKSRH